MEIFDLQMTNSYLTRENRGLRILVYTTKPDHWATWLHLLDHIKRQEKVMEKLRQKIKHLEIKLKLRTPDLLEPIIPEA